MVSKVSYGSTKVIAFFFKTSNPGPSSTTTKSFQNLEDRSPEVVTPSAAPTFSFPSSADDQEKTDVSLQIIYSDDYLMH